MADIESDHEKFPTNTLSSNEKSRNSDGPTCPDKFKRFEELPTELRLRIWKYAAFFQRTVDVLPFTVYNERLADSRPFMITDIFISSCPTPALLHVSRESRNEALKYYTVEFGTEQPILLRICGRKTTIPIPTPVIHINWEVDRVCVPSLAYFEDETANLLPLEAGTPIDMLSDLLWGKKVKSLALNVQERIDEDDALYLIRPGFLEEIIFFSWPQKNVWMLESYDFKDVTDDDVEDWLPLQQRVLDRCAAYISSCEEPPDPPCVLPRVRFCELVNVRLRSDPED